MNNIAKYFYSLTGSDVLGPVSPEYLEKLLDSKIINLQTKVCMESTEAWVEINTIPAFSIRKHKKTRFKTSEIIGICWLTLVFLIAGVMLAFEYSNSSSKPVVRETAKSSLPKPQLDSVEKENLNRGFEYANRQAQQYLDEEGLTGHFSIEPSIISTTSTEIRIRIKCHLLDQKGKALYGGGIIRKQVYPKLRIIYESFIRAQLASKSIPIEVSCDTNPFEKAPPSTN